MILGWMLYVLVVGLLLAAAARCLEEGARLLSLPVRWVWLAAMLGLVGLAAAAPLRTAQVPTLPAVEVTVPVGAEVRAAGESAGSASPLLHATRFLRELASAPLARGMAVAAAAGPAAGRAAGLLWAAASLLVLLAFGLTAARWAVRRRRWQAASMAGTPVRVAPDSGPAVVGLLRPEIVVPRWLAAAPEEEQRLVVLHETEHLRARDPALLALGCLVAALLPWHPAAWWMLLRLRLAVELDCDRRVLARGVRPLAYGSVLIDVAGRGSGIALGAPALADTPSTLERRISAMSNRISRFKVARAAALVLPAVLLVVVACEAELPTSAEIEAMDVAAVETQARHFRIIRGDEGESVQYFVDGEEVSAEEARSLMGDHVDAIEMVRSGEARDVQIRIRTREGEERGLRAEEREVRALRRQEDGEGRTMILHGRQVDGERDRFRIVGPAGPGEEGFEGILEIDGERADPSALRTLGPDRIESIEVVKGEAARQMYDDPAAEHGVIRVRTRQ